MSLSYFVRFENIYIRGMHHIKHRGFLSLVCTIIRKIIEPANYTGIFNWPSKESGVLIYQLIRIDSTESPTR